MPDKRPGRFAAPARPEPEVEEAFGRLVEEGRCGWPGRGRHGSARRRGRRYRRAGVPARRAGHRGTAAGRGGVRHRLRRAAAGIRLVAALLFGALLAAGQLFHSVLDSIFMFAARTAGRAPFGYLDWLDALAWSVFGNIVGGVGLVAFLRMPRVLHRLAQERTRHR